MFMDHYLEWIRSEPGFLHRHGERAAHGAPALQDRMEVIALGLHGAGEAGNRQAVPGEEADERDRLSDKQVEFSARADDRGPVLHAGSRGAHLEREIGNICRKVARRSVNAMARARTEKQAQPARAVINAAWCRSTWPPEVRDTEADKFERDRSGGRPRMDEVVGRF